MARKHIQRVSVLGLSAMLFGLSACGSQSDSGSATKGSEGTQTPAPVAAKSINDGKPITIKVYQSNAGITDTEFEELFSGPVKKKYPNVTLEMLRAGKGTSIEELVAANNMPDIIYTTSLDMTKFVVMETLADLNPFIAKNKFDLNVFDPNPIASIKLYSDKNELLALPLRLNWNVLYYNKTIFDRAAVPYPKDGLTWEDAIETGRRLTSKDPNIMALDPNGLRLVAQNMLVPFVDPKTDKSTATSPEWKYLFELFKSIQDIPDNKKSKKGVPGFEQDQTLAMYGSSAGRLAEFEDLYNKGAVPDWDMVTYPIRQGAPSKEQVTQAHILAVSSSSKIKDDAFEIISFLTTNMEAQEVIAKNGFLPALKDPRLKELFGKNLKSLQGKNTGAVFKNVYGSMAKPTRYDDLIRDANQKAFDQMIKDNLDLNTAIRMAQEAGDKAIAAEKAK